MNSLLAPLKTALENLMSVSLDTFRNIAQNGGSQQVLLDKPDPERAAEVKTRG
jgi:hypothetical protein